MWKEICTYVQFFFFFGLRQQKFILSQFRRVEVQNQGVNRAMLPLKAVGRGSFLAFYSPGGSRRSLVGGSLIPMSASLSIYTF